MPLVNSYSTYNIQTGRLVLPLNLTIVLEQFVSAWGIEGTYISHHPEYSPEDDDPLKGTRFVVSSPIDSSLRDLTERIVPLGTYYTAISSFVESRSHLDFGLVNHALCAAIRDMLKDHQILLSQLEHAFNTSPQFSLHK
ncbi:Spc98 family-domain-containing protein [Suillus americanus]|nr:Spc98 family-domain-containing protein [Suillus americanus]